MQLVFLPLSSDASDGIIENVERMVDGDVTSTNPKYLGPVRIQRFDEAPPNALVGETFVYHGTQYATEAAATAAWQA